MTLADLDVRAVPGGITIRGKCYPGLTPEDVSIVGGGVYLARLPDGAVIAELEPLPRNAATPIRRSARRARQRSARR